MTVHSGLDWACALRGQVAWCWGDDRQGQLGRGASSEDPRLPGSVEGLPPLASLDGGGNTACAVDLEGALYCWGSNRHGQLGDGGIDARATPVRVAGLPAILEVSVGFEHVCARDDLGGVHCWGWNGSGQAMPGGPLDVATPTRLEGLPPVVHVVAGYSDTCAITADGDAWCWGERSGPPRVRGTLVRAAAIGSDHLCLVSDGNTICHGAPPGGGRPPLPEEGRAYSVGGSIASGAIDHLCVLDEAIGISCWGKNESGAVGDGSQQFADLPASVRELEGRAHGVSVGRAHTCAVVDDRISCWGANERGQLGDPGVPTSLIPFDAPLP